MAAGHLTLKDIAREAGVSVATLDRVLHGRAGVRDDTARRVRETIARHGFHPSSAAADLARRRTSRFAVVVPDGGNLFMQAIVAAVGDMSAWLNARRASAETIRADVFNPAALAETLESLAGRYDGVAVVALDHQSVRAAIDDLVAAGTHVVTLVSDVPGSRRHHYVGIDNVAAGRTAGSLIGRFACGRMGEVGVVAGSQSLRDHAERAFGFHQVTGLEYPNLSALAPVEGGDRDEANETLTARLLADHPDLIGLYNVGAGTPGVMKALADSGREGEVVVVAHDLTPVTRRGLLRGAIDAVIVQDPGHEARSAMRVLLSLARREPILAEQEKIRVEIVMRDNLP
ncbi:LacI family transcriptional regulator [Roseiarcus fermentans]|uniref:LacI family transcriptional regulator n=1 Tax=Roseiarcus fermentans TaxID=1473586 RepID=A0A366F602_9HYPH|nr:LacI family DNA-binding transcriptional regulator [Roseiarcus fermentans]RBP09199.1 LacI family transcriptional regulator [Roseiarcus fermentans]